MGKPSELTFGEIFIKSAAGTQQVDPLGPLLFAIALHPLILQTQSRFELALNAWYLDDGNILVPSDTAADVLA